MRKTDARRGSVQTFVKEIQHLYRRRQLFMNINKFTQNSLQAVQNCEKLAYEYGNQEIDQEHLLAS